MKDNITLTDINILKESINKIEKKLIFSKIGISIGIFIMLLSLLSLMYQGSEILVGFFCLLFIGFFVIFINYLSLKERKKRINELNIDLLKMQKEYNSSMGV